MPTQFPTVSFCNIKSVNSSVPLGKTLVYKAAVNFTQTSLWEWLTIENYRLRMFVSNDPAMTAALKKSVGFLIEDMLVSCYYNYKPCNASDLTYFYNQQYGNCYKFNGGKDDNGNSQSIKQSSISGYLNGLILEFFCWQTFN